MAFRDFCPEQVLRAGPIPVSEQEIIEFAEKYDPQWFHVDPKRALAGRWNGLIASGWHTCAIAMRLAWIAALENSEESIGSPGLAYLKWPWPVRPGDALRFEGHILDVQIRRETRGVLRWRWLLFNQDDNEVLDLEATSFFDLSPESEINSQ